MAKRSYQVRVLAGALKGRLLTYPNHPGVRPTLQRTKESVFESLGGDLTGAVFVDLYAGAGGIGIEAISRGADRVHFVEHRRAALECLQGNLNRCRIEEDRFRVHAVDVLDFLRDAGSRGIRADVIYADPPYAGEDLGVLLEFLGRMDYPPGSVLVLEHPRGVLLRPPDRFVRTRLKTFGQTNVSFLIPAEGEVL